MGELHSILQARRREMQTDAFQEEMHRRNGIEVTLDFGVKTEPVRVWCGKISSVAK